jgi:CheY-like chemotaxis protein
VDDDPQQLEIRKLLLEAAGYEVAVAATAADAERLLDELHPEVLLMDLRLPKLKDGIRLIHSADQQNPRAKIIVLSGWIEDLCDLPEEKLVSRLLRKPIRNDSLIEAIELARSGYADRR